MKRYFKAVRKVEDAEAAGPPTGAAPDAASDSKKPRGSPLSQHSPRGSAGSDKPTSEQTGAPVPPVPTFLPATGKELLTPECPTGPQEPRNDGGPQSPTLAEARVAVGEAGREDTTGQGQAVAEETRERARVEGSAQGEDSRPAAAPATLQHPLRYRPSIPMTVACTDSGLRHRTTPVLAPCTL